MRLAYHFHRGRLLFGWGRDMARMLPATVYLTWLRADWRETDRHSMLPCVWRVSASWEWFPRLLRLYGPRRYDCFDSAAWTGRDHEVIGCRWDACGSIRVGPWRKGFSFGRLWGPDWA